MLRWWNKVWGTESEPDLSAPAIKYLRNLPHEEGWELTSEMEEYVRKGLEGVTQSDTTLSRILRNEHEFEKGMAWRQKSEEDPHSALDVFTPDDVYHTFVEEADNDLPKHSAEEIAMSVLRHKLLAFLRCTVEPECKMLEEVGFRDETGADVKTIGDIARTNLALRNRLKGGMQNVVSATSESSMFELERRAAFRSEADAFIKAQRPQPQMVIIGSTSSGKSSFINCLLEERLLPDDFAPCTNTICHLEGGRMSQILSAPLASAGTDEVQWAPLEGSQGQVNATLLKMLVASRDGAASEESPSMYRASLGSDILSHVEVVDTPGLGDKHQQYVWANGCKLLKSAARNGLIVMIINAGKGAKRVVDMINNYKVPVTKNNCLVVVTKLDQAVKAQMFARASSEQAENALDEIYRALQTVEGFRDMSNEELAKFVVKCNLQKALNYVEGKVLQGRVALCTQVVSPELMRLREVVATQLSGVFRRQTEEELHYCLGSMNSFLSQVQRKVREFEAGAREREARVRRAQGEKQLGIAEAQKQVLRFKEALVAITAAQSSFSCHIDSFLDELQTEYKVKLLPMADSAKDELHRELLAYIATDRFKNAFVEEKAAESVRFQDVRGLSVDACIKKAMEQMVFHVHNAVLIQVEERQEKAVGALMAGLDKWFSQKVQTYTKILRSCHLEDFSAADAELHRNRNDQSFVARFIEIENKEAVIPERIQNDYDRIEKVFREHGEKFKSHNVACLILFEEERKIPPKSETEKKFRQLAKLFHPDKWGSAPDLTRKKVVGAFSVITRAKDIINEVPNPAHCHFLLSDELVCPETGATTKERMGDPVLDGYIRSAQQLDVRTFSWDFVGKGALAGAFSRLALAESLTVVVGASMGWAAVGLASIFGLISTCTSWSTGSIKSQPQKFATEILSKSKLRESHHSKRAQILGVSEVAGNVMKASTLAAYVPFKAAAQERTRQLAEMEDSLRKELNQAVKDLEKESNDENRQQVILQFQEDLEVYKEDYLIPAKRIETCLKTNISHMRELSPGQGGASQQT